MGRRSNTAERRQQITAALMRVMATQGYEKASVKTIAAEAGLTPGLVHYHFKSKQDILVALVAALAETVAARFDQLAAGLSDPRARLLAFVDAHLALGADARPEAVASWVAIGAEALRQPEVHAVYAEALTQRYETMCALVAEAGGSAPVALAVRSAAAGLLSAIEGAYQIATAAPALMPSGFAGPTVRAMASTMLNTIHPEPGGSR